MSLNYGLIKSCLEILTCLILINFICWWYFVLGSSFKHTAELGLFNLRVSFKRWVNLCSLWLLIYLDLFLPSCLFLFISSVQLLSCVQLFATPWTAAHQASLSLISQSLPKFIHWISDADPHLTLSHTLLPSIFPSIKVFSSETAVLHQVDKGLELQLQHQSFQWVFRVDFF